MRTQHLRILVKKGAFGAGYRSIMMSEELKRDSLFRDCASNYSSNQHIRTASVWQEERE